MTNRKRRTGKQRLALLKAHDGKCYLCNGAIGVGEKWEIEHVIALEISGDDSDENCRPAHAKCHKAKTVKDAATIAKAKRREIKNQGATAPKQKIKSAPFAKAERPEKTRKQSLPPRAIYR